MSVRAVLTSALAVAIGHGSPVTSAAQARAAERIGVRVGAVIPTGAFSDVARMGMMLGAHWQTGFGGTLRFQFDMDHARLSIRDDRIATPGALGGGSIRDRHFALLGGVAGVVFPSPGSADGLYGLGGVGAYSLGDDLPGSSSSSHFAFSVGAGVGRDRWFVEMRYRCGHDSLPDAWPSGHAYLTVGVWGGARTNGLLAAVLPPQSI